MLGYREAVPPSSPGLAPLRGLPWDGAHSVPTTKWLRLLAPLRTDTILHQAQKMWVRARAAPWASPRVAPSELQSSADTAIAALICVRLTEGGQAHMPRRPTSYGTSPNQPGV